MTRAPQKNIARRQDQTFADLKAWEVPETAKLRDPIQFLELGGLSLIRASAPTLVRWRLALFIENEASHRQCGRQGEQTRKKPTPLEGAHLRLVTRSLL